MKKKDLVTCCRLMLYYATVSLLISCGNSRPGESNDIVEKKDKKELTKLESNNGIEEMRNRVDQFPLFSSNQKEFTKEMLDIIYDEIEDCLSNNKFKVRKAYNRINRKVTIGVDGAIEELNKLHDSGSPISSKSLEIMINKSIVIFNETHKTERLFSVVFSPLPPMVETESFKNEDDNWLMQFIIITPNFKKFYYSYVNNVLLKYNSFFVEQNLFEQMSGLSK